MRKSIGLMLAATLVSSGSAKPREVRHLAPSSQWVVNWADQSCSLGRAFGEGDHKVTLFFDHFEPGDNFNLMVAGKRIDEVEGWPAAAVQFGPNEEPSEATAVGAKTNDTPAIIFQGGQRIAPLTKVEKIARRRNAEDGPPFEPAPIGPAREKAATWLLISKIQHFDLLLDTGPMDAPLAALRDCSWDMVKSWGLDVEQQKHLSAKAYPTMPAYKWFSENDYPTAMLKSGSQAIVNFRVLVDATGKPTACQIQTSTRPKAFDDVVCANIMKRARFHPALSAAGKPVPSFWRQTVNFRLAM